MGSGACTFVKRWFSSFLLGQAGNTGDHSGRPTHVKEFHARLPLLDVGRILILCIHSGHSGLPVIVDFGLFGGDVLGRALATESKPVLKCVA